VRISWKTSWQFLCLAALAGSSLLLAGCGGVNASQTVSPASFLLPGLLRADPPQTNAPAATVQNPVEVAAVR